MIDNPQTLPAAEAEALAGRAPTEQNWGQKVYGGLRLLLWTTIIEWLVVYLAIVAIPLVAKYTGALDQVPAIYRWVRLVPALTGIPLLIAIFRLTSRQSNATGCHWIGVVRIGLRLLIGFELFARWVATPAGWTAVVWRAWSLTCVTEILLLSIYLAAFAVALGRTRLARLVVLAGVAVVAAGPTLAVLLDWISRWVTISDRAQLNTDVLLSIATGIVAISVLMRYCSMWRRFVEDRCLHCAYALRGLATPRCPECGTPFKRFPSRVSARTVLGVAGREDRSRE